MPIVATFTLFVKKLLVVEMAAFWLITRCSWRAGLEWTSGLQMLI